MTYIQPKHQLLGSLGFRVVYNHTFQTPILALLILAWPSQEHEIFSGFMYNSTIIKSCNVWPYVAEFMSVLNWFKLI